MHWDAKVLLKGIFVQLSYYNPCSIIPNQSKRFELTDLTISSDTVFSHPRSSVASRHTLFCQRPSTTQTHTSWSDTGPSSCTIKAPSTPMVIYILLVQLKEGKNVWIQDVSGINSTRRYPGLLRNLCGTLILGNLIGTIAFAPCVTPEASQGTTLLSPPIHYKFYNSVIIAL